MSDNARAINFTEGATPEEIAQFTAAKEAALQKAAQNPKPESPAPVINLNSNPEDRKPVPGRAEMDPSDRVQVHELVTKAVDQPNKE